MIDMKKYSWFALVPIIGVLAVVIVLKDYNQTSYEEAEVETSVWSEPDIANSLSDAIETDFEFDVDRLYDISYEIDKELVAFADSIGKSPACVIELVKRQVDGIIPNESKCKKDTLIEGHDAQVLLPGTYETVCRIYDGQEICRRVKVADHPYEHYSNDELISLASSSPEASIILARRLPDDYESEKYYEQAVALSGRPGPLEEWMLHRNLGGLVRHNGVLDIEKAALGYEIYLTTARLGYGDDAVAEFERHLLQEGIDLELVRARATDRFNRITALRKSLVANGWEG